MEQFKETIDRISELSEEELNSFEESVLSEFAAVESQNPTREVVDKMTELADAADLIKAEKNRRAEEASELAAQAAEAANRVNGISEAEGVAEEAELSDNSEEVNEDEKVTEFSTADTAEEAPAESVVDAPSESELSVEEEAPAEEPVTELSTEAEPVEEAPAESELSSETTPSAEDAPAEAELSVEETETTPEPVAELSTDETESSEEPVTASNTPNEGLGSDFEAPADRRPNVDAKPPVTITAGADLKNVTMGQELPNLRAVAQCLLDRRKAMGRTTGGDGEQALVASFHTNYSNDRILNSDDFEGNRKKIEEATAVVAAGGLLGPVETSYDIFELGETEARPVRDSLPVFGADRGGIRYLTPPVLEDLNGAVALWTIDDDIAAASGGSPTKPCIRVTAGTEVEVVIDAITFCLTIGNLGARAFPELVERHIQLGKVEHARFAEVRLLTRIGQLSTPVTAAAELGAARDILVQLEQAAAAYRNRYRISPNAALRVMFPEWFKNALRADLVKQLPGDGRDGTFNLADAEIESWFRTRNINVTWFLDGEEGQTFGAQTAGGAGVDTIPGNADDTPAVLDGFPTEVIWYLFAEGTFLFLDGGVLDLGLVRDSTLNATNDYKLFLETFENVAKVGVESLRITSALLIAGASAATVATTA